MVRESVTENQVANALDLLWFVFVKGHNHLVLREDTVDLQAIEAAGFSLVWDSAPNEFSGAKYAATHYGAVVPVAKKGGA